MKSDPKESLDLISPQTPSAQTVPNQGSLLFYTTPKGTLKINVYFQGETAWLTQKALADLFGVQVPAIAKHLRNIYESGELVREATVSKMEIVRQEGEREVARPIEFYNLDAIIAVGYRVNSFQATQFRIWATETLKEFLVKGFTLDDERMKQGPNAFGKDYFDELLERIREIRASERRFYQKITDIYALSMDYDKSAPKPSKARDPHEDGGLGAVPWRLPGTLQISELAWQGADQCP